MFSEAGEMLKLNLRNKYGALQQWYWDMKGEVEWWWEHK